MDIAHVRAAVCASPPHRAQSRAEEWANTLSHAFGCAIALAAWPLLADAAQRHSGTRGALAVGLFCATMVPQYAASTACHGLPPGRAKQRFRAIDHAAIFVFIAGSASPFTLGAMDGAAGALTSGLVWTLALWGAALKLQRRLTNRRLSTGLYTLFGWIAVLAAWQGARMVDATALGWLLAGGIAYLVAPRSSSAMRRCASATSSGTCACWPAASATSAPPPAPERACSPERGKPGSRSTVIDVLCIQSTTDVNPCPPLST